MDKKEICSCKSSIILVIGRMAICVLIVIFFFHSILLPIPSQMQGDLLDIVFFVIGFIVICFAFCFIIYELIDRMKVYEVSLYEDGITIKQGKRIDHIHFDEINHFSNSRVKTVHYFDIVLIDGRQEMLFSFSILEAWRWQNFVIEIKAAYTLWFGTDRAREVRGRRRKILKRRFWYDSPSTNLFGEKEDYL